MCSVKLETPEYTWGWVMIAFRVDEAVEWWFTRIRLVERGNQQQYYESAVKFCIVRKRCFKNIRSVFFSINQIIIFKFV